MTLSVSMIVAMFAMAMAVTSAAMLWGVAGLTLILGLVLGFLAMLDVLERRIVRTIEAAFFNSTRD
jgi:hypothetical protein